MAEIREIPLSAIIPPKLPVRTGADEAAIAKLADSIKSLGLINPITVRPVGDQFEVVAGHRRLIATAMAGLPTIPAIVADADDSRTALIKLEENFQREDVNIVDEAYFYQRLLEELKIPISELSQKIRRSEEYIKDRLAILNWDPQFLEALVTGKISYSAAKPLTQIPDRTDRLHYLNCAINAGASSLVTLGWLRAWREKKPTEPPPPETIERKEGPVVVSYCTEPCWVCGELVPVNEAYFPTCHRQCYMELQRQALMRSQEPPEGEIKETP